MHISLGFQISLHCKLTVCEIHCPTKFLSGLSSGFLNMYHSNTFKLAFCCISVHGYDEINAFRAGNMNWKLFPIGLPATDFRVDDKRVVF